MLRGNSRQLAGFLFLHDTKKDEKKDCVSFLVLYPEEGDEQEISYFSHSILQNENSSTFYSQKF